MENELTGDRNGLLKAAEVNVDPVPAPVPCGIFERPPAQAADAEQEPHVDYVRDENGVVTVILVHCPCGRRIKLQCEYVDGGTS